MELLQKLEKMNHSLTELKRREKRLLMEIAKVEVERVKAVLQAREKAWVYRADGGLEYLNWVVEEIRDVVKESGLVLLACGEGKTGGQIIILGQKRSVEELVNKVKMIIQELKGGGSGGKWQGKVIEWGKGEVEALRKTIEG